MKKDIQPPLELFMAINKMQFKMNRWFDASLNGLSFTELIILDHLNKAPDKKLRRIDLAEKVGLTASGITRLLLPMEKIGLVGRAGDERDARVKFVTLTKGGAQKLSEEIVYANKKAEGKYPKNESSKIKKIIQIINEINE